MKLMTSGYLHRLFQKEDPGTIVRRNNVRRIAKIKNIKHIMTNNIILIDVDEFLCKTNPYKITEHVYDIPRLRTVTSAAAEWNKHRKKERYIHVDEITALFKTNIPVFRYRHGNRWIVNYDQLEPFLKEVAKTPSPLWIACQERAKKKKVTSK